MWRCAMHVSEGGEGGGEEGVVLGKCVGGGVGMVCTFFAMRRALPMPIRETSITDALGLL